MEELSKLFKGDLIVGAHVMWRRWTYGDWVPNTFYAKVASDPTIQLEGLRYLWEAALSFGVLLFLGEDVFHDAPRGGIVLAQVIDDLAVTVDGDALGDQVLLDHLLERVALDILGVRAGLDALRREVGRAAQLDDARRKPVGMLLLLLGVFEELVGGDVRDGEFLSGVLADVKPAAVIHCAAMVDVE